MVIMAVSAFYIGLTVLQPSDKMLQREIFRFKALTLQDPNLPCKRQNSLASVKLYQILQDYIYVPADFDTI